MSSQLKSLGIPFAVQEGVDGKIYDFSNDYDEQLSKKLNGSPLADVEKGCALSHRYALKKSIDEKIEYALILEDDVELPNNFKKIIENEIMKREKCESGWEYLSFNYPTVGIKFIKLWFFLLSEQFKKRPSLFLYIKIPLYVTKGLMIVIFSFYEGTRDLLYKKIYKYGVPSKFYRPIYLAGCYLVTSSGSKKILSINEKLVYPADRIQNVARIKKGLRLYWFVPLIVKQRRDKFESTMYQNKNYVFNEYD
jgi:GR25 family glycosyltransferase involved in LPS biosynthesis